MIIVFKVISLAFDPNLSSRKYDQKVIEKLFCASHRLLLDINECDISNGNCDHICINRNGR